MHNVTERNERNARRHALVLALGLHLSLGFLLYTQMSDSKSPKVQSPLPEAQAKTAAGPVAKVVNKP